ncbi:MAG TPA: SRPBCC family protein [Candidatus Limnocylindrales bacterium]|nr:SRPBCC family protein [Candidatus Limnocylindrales bacterium]
MAQDQAKFWTGFAAGAAAGALAGIGAVLAFKRSSETAGDHVVRLEKSVNIGRPVSAVFAAWQNLERLPQSISFVKRIERFGTQSRWLVNIDGRDVEWDVQITQVVPNQSIGWKSLSGPYHTGRISFAPLGEQTVVHVLMNYAPPMGGFSSMLPIEQHLQQWIERGLRDFKAALERESGSQRSQGNEDRSGGWEPLQRTGTDTAQPWNESSGPVGTPGKPSAPGTVNYTRPPKDKY